MRCRDVVVTLAVIMSAGAVRSTWSQPDARPDAFHRELDDLLDGHVRDGFVYYNALKADRTRLARYVARLDGHEALAEVEGSTAARRAFWINAYNALVLQTVVDHHPIRGTTSRYPARSVRQIPGAFDRRRHQVAGRSLTLDEIETEILVPLGDARVFLALGRGAVGGGRLRSEAYVAGRLEEQLRAVAAETLQRGQMVRIDGPADQLVVSPLFSWREAAFAAALAASADARFSERSPIERAVLGLIEPYLMPAERDVLGRNTFRMTYRDFDWRLNDLASRSR
jgi:hypothetical protein